MDENNVVSLDELVEKQKLNVEKALKEGGEKAKAEILNLRELEAMRMARVKENNNYDIERDKLDKMEDRSNVDPWWKKYGVDILKITVGAGLYIFAINRRTKEKDAAMIFEQTGEYNGLIRSSAARRACNDDKVDMPRL